MGQLERYGLYVLCVVIFLILGVALWGGDPAQAAGAEQLAAAVSRDLRSPAPEVTPVESKRVPPADDDTVAKLRRAFTSSSESDATPDDGKGLQLAGVTSGDKTGTPPALDAGKQEPKPVAKVEVPPAGGSVDYVVKKNDNLEAIALAHFGKRTAWPEIVKANPGLSPTSLTIGAKIKLPPKSVLTAAAPAAAPLQADEYVIKPDDTLEAVALAKLGKKTRWHDIVAANPGLNPAKLRPGTRIKIPALTTAKATPSR